MITSLRRTPTYWIFSIGSIGGIARTPLANDNWFVDVGSCAFISTAVHPQRFLLFVLFRLASQIFDLFLASSAWPGLTVTPSAYLGQWCAVYQVTFTALLRSVVGLGSFRAAYLVGVWPDSHRRPEEILELSENDVP
jgi:hypothetical protein